MMCVDVLARVCLRKRGRQGLLLLHSKMCRVDITSDRAGTSRHTRCSTTSTKERSRWCLSHS